MNTKKTRGKTLRQISEIVRDHLTQQKARAVRYPQHPGSRCTYLAEDGSMCAVGCLLDKGITQLVDGGVLQLYKQHPELGITSKQELDMLQHWQSYHDSRVEIGYSYHSYGKWLGGDYHALATSPAEFHELLCAKLGLE